MMNAFNITDNNLDHDTTQNTQKRAEQPEVEITWLTKEQFEAAMQSDVKGISATLERYSTNTHKMKRDFKSQLEDQLTILINQ